MGRPSTIRHSLLAIRRPRQGRGSIGWRRREETAARTVGALAAPELAVRARLRLVERDGLAVGQVVAGRRDADLLARDDETVAFAATPFARRIAQRATRDPAVMRERL